jgi:Secretion system C-terminal sorting domain
MKKLLVFLCFLLFSFTALPQVTFNIQSNFGNPYCFLRSTLPTDSCYFATGIIKDSMNTQGTIFIKFDLNGDTVFTKRLIKPGKWYEVWYGDMLATGDSCILKLGTVADTIYRGAIFKFNSFGDTVLTKEYITPSQSYNIFLPFEFAKGINGKTWMLSSIGNSNTNDNDIALTLLDEQLDAEMSYFYGNSLREIPKSMIVEQDGGIILGAAKNNQNTNLKNFTSRTYIFKVDSLGNVVWEYLSPQGQLRDVAYSMVKTPDGGLVVASGKGIEYEVNSNVSYLLWKGYLFKLNANHQQVWGRELRGTSYDIGMSFIKVVTATDGGGFTAYGRVVEDVSVGTEQVGSWIVKVSNQGDSLWARYYTFFDGHDRRPTPVDFKATPDGGYIVAGQTEEGLETFGWLMKLDSFGCLIPGCNANDGPNATTEEQVELKLAIYPNPTSDFLNFELRSPRLPQSASFRIVDAMGKLVKELQSNSPRDTFIVPVREWASGVYWLQYLEEGEVRAVERFVVVR